LEYAPPTALKAQKSMSEKYVWLISILFLVFRVYFKSFAKSTDPRQQFAVSFKAAYFQQG
jgi:hypothetical protein